MGTTARLLIAAAVIAAVAALPAASRPADSARGVRVSVYFPQGDPGARCNRVLPVSRTVVFPALLRGAMTELLEGPSAAERARGYGGWFSRRTAGMLRSVRIAAGVAYVDFRDFRRIIPNASSSCGSALLLAQLNRTATQFASVDRALYAINGSRRAFYEWLQYSVPVTQLAGALGGVTAPPVGPLPPDVGPTIVPVYKAAGLGRSRIVYALTKGETPKALAAIRYEVTVVRP